MPQKAKKVPRYVKEALQELEQEKQQKLQQLAQEQQLKTKKLSSNASKVQKPGGTKLDAKKGKGSKGAAKGRSKSKS